MIGMACPRTSAACSGGIRQGVRVARAMSRPCTRHSLSSRPVAAATVRAGRGPYQGVATGVSGARSAVARRKRAVRAATNPAASPSSCLPSMVTARPFTTAIRGPKGRSAVGSSSSQSTVSSLDTEEQ